MEPDVTPYVTVDFTGSRWRPTLYAWHPLGYWQISDERPGDEDRLEAKRTAVTWAADLNVPFKVPVS